MDFFSQLYTEIVIHSENRLKHFSSVFQMFLVPSHFLQSYSSTFSFNYREEFKVFFILQMRIIMQSWIKLFSIEAQSENNKQNIKSLLERYLTFPVLANTIWILIHQ